MLDRETNKRFRVVQPAGAGQAVNATWVRNDLLDGAGQRETTQEDLTACASCGRVMKDASGIGASCNSCGKVICAECSQSRCPICNQACCDNDECSSVLNVKVCGQHSFLAYMRFAFTGKR